MKLEFVAAAAMAAALSPAAFAEEAAPRSYASFSGVYAASTEYSYSEPRRVTADIDPGAGLVAAYGARLGDRYRLEAAFSMSWQDLVTTGYNGPEPANWPEIFDPWLETYPLANGELGLYRLTANGYVDLARSGPVRPYIGAGAGVAAVDLADGAVEGVASAFTGELIAGVSVPVDKSVSLFVDARYVYVGPIQIDSDGDDDSDSSFDMSGVQATAGIRLHF